MSDGDIGQRSFRITATVGRLVVRRIAVAAAKQTEEGGTGVGEVFRNRDADGSVNSRCWLIIYRSYRDGGGARISVVRRRTGYQALSRVRRHIATVVHGGGQQVAAVVIGGRGVFQQIKCRIYSGAGALHMNAGRAVGGAVNQREPRHAAEGQRPVVDRHIGLHHIVDNIRVGDGKCTGQCQGAVLGNSEGGRRSQHRRVVYAGYGERHARCRGQVAAADVAVIVDRGGKRLYPGEVGVTGIDKIVAAEPCIYVSDQTGQHHRCGAVSTGCNRGRIRECQRSMGNR